MSLPSVKDDLYFFRTIETSLLFILIRKQPCVGPNLRVEDSFNPPDTAGDSLTLVHINDHAL